MRLLYEYHATDMYVFHIIKFPIRVVPTCWHKKKIVVILSSKNSVWSYISIQSEWQKRLQAYIHQAMHYQKHYEAGIA